MTGQTWDTVMCMAVYIAADQPLSPADWDEACPAFYVAALAESDLPVRAQFTKAHVMYAGSHEGCGCGFQYGEYPELLEPEQAACRRASLDQFATFLESEVRRVGPIQLYACWEGDQAAPVEHRRALTPTLLKSKGFFIRQKELSLVTTES
jgi:hypothetical protein